MRKVFPNSRSCACAWAEGWAPYGKSSNTSFDGPVFKSYSTPVAKLFQTSGLGRPMCLLSSKEYSHTTSRHIHQLRYFVRDEYCMLHSRVNVDVDMPVVDRYPTRHKENLVELWTSAMRCHQDSRRSRGRADDWEYGMWVALYNMREYITAFGLDVCAKTGSGWPLISEVCGRVLAMVPPPDPKAVGLPEVGVDIVDIVERGEISKMLGAYGGFQYRAGR